MYKKSFFRGLGTGLIVGALTVTVAFNFDNAGKNDSGQGSQANVIQQETPGTTEKSPDQSDDTEDKGTTEKNTTEKNTTEKSSSANDGTDKKATGQSTGEATTEKTAGGTDNGKSDVNGKGDVYSGGSKDGTSSSDSSDNSKDGTSSSDSSDNSKDGTSSSDSSDNSKDGTSSSNSSDNSAGGNGGLSDNTQRVPSSKDNGYTEDKNSQTGESPSTDKNADKTEPTTEAPTEASTEAVKASAIKYDNGGGEITFGSNTSAYEICQLLAQIGLRDADEYYDWLLRSGYSASLVPGTYTFSGNETNGGIVWILLGNQ